MGETEFDRVLAENDRYAESFDRSALTAAPLRHLAVVACMDARLNVEAALGLRPGEAHVIRNAGGLATEDVIRWRRVRPRRASPLDRSRA